MLIFNIKLYIY